MSNNAVEVALDNAGTWKAWVLLCVAEASRMGLAPLAAPQVHVILYLANTLAELFAIDRARGRVLKRGPYPFFPDVQREIDRLAFAGVLSIERVEFGPKGHLTASYGIAPKGRTIHAALLERAAEARRTAKLFRELVSACFGRFLVTTVNIGPIDANYGNTNVLDGEVVDFAEWTDENKNLELARYLMDRLRTLRPDAERDGVRLYCDYLDRALGPAKKALAPA